MFLLVHETYFMFYLPSQKKVVLACRWIWSYLRTWCWWVEVEVWMAHHFQVGVQGSVFPLWRWHSERIVHKLSIGPGMPFLLRGTPLTWKPHFCQPTLREEKGDTTLQCMRMPNTVSKGFDTAMKMGSSRRFKLYPTTYIWVSSQIPFTGY